MANVNSKPSYQAHLSKTGFDVSQTFNFSSSCGHILPVWYDIANPGEHYSLSTNLFTRTQPLASAPMVDIDEYVDWFFVPFSLIYGNFDSWIYGINDQHSSLMVNQLKNGGSIALPCIDATGGDYEGKATGLDINNRHPSVTGEPIFEDWNRMAARLCDHLEQVPFEALHKGSKYSFPFYNFAAYQCICDRYYRNTQYVTSNVKAYNFDDLLGVPKSYLGWSNVAPGSPQVSTEVDIKRTLDLFRLHYRPYALDYFTNVQPSPLQNATNMLATAFTSKGATEPSTLKTDMLLKVNNWLDNRNYEQSVVSADTQFHYIDELYNKFGTNVGNTTLNFNTNLANLRSNFAIEKLLSITQRAGKHYDDQTLAHFGIKTDKDKYHDVLCIGQHKQQIHIGEVIATATTAGDESSTLGEIAGKGYGSGDSKKISFDVPCHGIIMACYSCVPRLKRQIEVNKLNMRVHREDFYQPELDNLGMQPLFAYELNGQPFHTQSDNDMGESAPYQAPGNKVCAWQYRYMESKVKYDRTSKAFLPDYPFQSWTITTDFINPFSVPGVVSTGKMFTDYVSSLFCSPNALDQIMLVGYDSSFIRAEGDSQRPISESDGVRYIYKQVYARDPLFHNLRVNAYKTSSMSAYGLPRLD
ncbi:major capsid protein [Microvirus sp.]|nr:major capsid protein [Microvirus sp.]